MSTRALILFFTGVVVALISIDDTNASPSLENAQEFIGSIVSVTSKSDSRYEGTFNSMDSKEETISLAKVRSFGTEDRPTNRFIPINDEIYEFVVFRDSYIKSIDVVAAPNKEAGEESESEEGEVGLFD